jgi:putative FmdB family regulatory protein
MPHYEYECTSCGKHFEYFQKMSDPPMETCEECGGHLQKLLSAGSGLIFKGSGFYITDYKGKNASSESSGSDGGVSGEKKGSDSDGSKSEAPKAGESKPATAPVPAAKKSE